MNTPKNILLITPFAPPNIGGAETHLEDLYEYLRENEYKVTLLTYQPLTGRINGLPLEKKENLIIKRYRWFGNNLFAKFEKYPPIFNFLYITPYLFIISCWYMIWNRKKVDIIHVFGLNAAFIARILKFIFQKKCIMSTEALYEFNLENWFGKISRWVLMGMDAVLAGSEESKNDVMRLNLPKEKVIEYTHWINTDRFRPLDKTMAKQTLGWEQKFTALYVGRLIKMKGIEVFIEIAKQVPNVNFKIIGDSGPELEVAQKADNELINLEFIGKVDNNKIPPYFAAADVFIYPALYNEDLARTLLEAMACGTPVINTNPGSGIYKLDSKSSFVTSRDPSHMADKVKKLASNPDLAKSMSEQAIIFAKNFGPILGKTITNTYEKMLNITPQKSILYYFFYGDQHHPECKAEKEGRKVISDGGASIHINFILRIPETYSINFYTFKHNYQAHNFFYTKKNINIKEFQTLSALFNAYLISIETFTRCIYPGLLFIFKKTHQSTLITQTDFLPDTWAAFLTKIRNPKIKWVASFFLAAPKPWQKDSPYKGKRWIIGLFYWLQQMPSLWFIKWKADMVLVTSDPDANRFITKKRDRSKIMVIQGGVNTEASRKYLAGTSIIPVEKRKFDACFIGRFHFQKGVLTLMDIWKEVCRGKKHAKLAMVGHGPLEREVREKIKEYKLEENIHLLGFKDGEEKNEIFKQSKLIVHPATYDSGGMAAAEGMAWKLPGVSFDLESLKTYYPKGMLKVPQNDTQAFAKAVLRLLEDRKLYDTTANEALELIREVWDWKRRAKQMVDTLLES